MYTYTNICSDIFLNSSKHTIHGAFGLCCSSCINPVGNFWVGAVPRSQGYVEDSYNFHFYGNLSAEMLESLECSPQKSLKYLVFLD